MTLEIGSSPPFWLDSANFGARHVRQRLLFFMSKTIKSRKSLNIWLQQLLVENMSSVDDQEIEEIAQKITSEVEHTSSKDLAESEEMIKILHLTSVHHVKTLFQHMDEASTRSERNVGKKAVIKALLVSTWHQRLLHSKISYYGLNQRLRYIRFHSGFRFDKLHARNWFRGILVCTFFGCVKIV